TWPLAMFAAHHRAAGTLALLLERGATIPREHAALILANIAGAQPPDAATSVVTNLLGLDRLLSDPKVGASALLNAALGGNQAVLELLRAAGVPISAQGADGRTVTHVLIGPKRS